MDVDFESSPARFKIRAGNTKSRQEHEGYFSTEALAAVKRITKDKSDEDFVFHNRKLPYDPKAQIFQRCWTINEMKYFSTLRKRVGFNDKYITGRSTKTIHNFRSFFFTWASLENGDGYAHAFPDLLAHEPVPHAQRRLEGELLSVAQLGHRELLVDLLEAKYPEGHVPGLVGHHVAKQLLE